MSERSVCIGSLVGRGRMPQECVGCPLGDIAQQVTRRISSKFTHPNPDALEILQSAHQEAGNSGSSRQHLAKQILQESAGIAIAKLATATPRRSITECPRR